MRVALHIGYPKTGTTFLQRSVFPALDSREVHYISNAFLERNGLHEICFKFPDSIDIDSYREKLRLEPKKLNLISYEGFTGDWRTGAMNRANLFMTLKRVFEKPRILVVIRQQPSIILSLYKQYVQEGGTSTLRTFLGDRKGSIFFNKDFVKYDLLLKQLIDVFGPEHIDFLLYEMMASDESAFYSLLEQILEVPFPKNLPKDRQNKSLHDHLLGILRYSNYFLSGFIHPNSIVSPSIFTSNKLRKLLQGRLNNWLHKFSPKNKDLVTRIGQDQFDEILAYYAKSNLNIGEFMKSRYCIDLANHGYQMSI